MVGRIRRRRITGALLAGVSVLLAGAALVDYFGYPYGRPIDALIADRGENALWLRYTHYFGEFSDSQITALGRDLERRRIRHAWFHVRGVDAAGDLVFRRPDEARRLLSTLRRAAPGVRTLAWLSVDNAAAGGPVDLSRPDVRAHIAQSARWLTETCGFDGVQIDYEACPSDDANLLALLADVRAALPAKAILGVCAPAWLPLNLGWSEPYIRQVAARCDGIAVMDYDTGFVTPRAYIWLTGEQVTRYCRAARSGNSKCRVWIGVPTYDAGLRSHNPRAENLVNALRGVRDGLQYVRNAESGADSFAGVAIFADYTTEPDEWRAYESLWLGNISETDDTGANRPENR